MKRNVTAAIIVQDGKVLVCQRKIQSSYGGLWEFPGGKQEEQESLAACLEREIQEELGTKIQIEAYLGVEENEKIRLHFFLCHLAGPEPCLREHEAFYWALPRELSGFAFCQLDEVFLKRWGTSFMDSVKRIFIGIPLPAALRQQLEEVQLTWQKQGVTGRWTPVANTHITLAFIGETPFWKKAIEVVSQVNGEAGFLEVDGFGHFGSLYFANVHASGTICSYVARLRQAFKEAGFPVDKKAFHPHITLIRKADMPLGIELSVPAFTWECKEAVVYESVLGSGPASYRTLYTRSLSNC